MNTVPVFEKWNKDYKKQIQLHDHINTFYNFVYMSFVGISLRRLVMNLARELFMKSTPMTMLYCQFGREKLWEKSKKWSES